MISQYSLRKASSGMWEAGRSDITALFNFLTRQRSNDTRVILKERDIIEEGCVSSKRLTAINHIITRTKRQNTMRGHSHGWLNLEEGLLARKKGESKMEEQEDLKQKQGRIWVVKLAKSQPNEKRADKQKNIPSQRWTDKLAKSLPNWLTVMPGPGHF